VLGVRPRTPGWSEVDVRPSGGALAWCEGRVPTPRGPIDVRWDRAPSFRIHISLPAGIAAHVAIPIGDGVGQVWVNGQKVPAHRDGSWWMLDTTVVGSPVVELR